MLLFVGIWRALLSGVSGSSPPPPSTDAWLWEDGTAILWEDGGKVLLETGP